MIRSFAVAVYTNFDFLNFLAYRSNSIERNNRVNEIRIEIVVIPYHILDEKILARDELYLLEEIFLTR